MIDSFKPILNDIAKSQSQIYRAEIAAELEAELRRFTEMEAALQKITEILGKDHA